MPGHEADNSNSHLSENEKAWVTARDSDDVNVLNSLLEHEDECVRSMAKATLKVLKTRKVK